MNQNDVVAENLMIKCQNQEQNSLVIKIQQKIDPNLDLKNHVKEFFDILTHFPDNQNDMNFQARIKDTFTFLIYLAAQKDPSITQISLEQFSQLQILFKFNTQDDLIITEYACKLISSLSNYLEFIDFFIQNNFFKNMVQTLQFRPIFPYIKDFLDHWKIAFHDGLSQINLISYCLSPQNDILSSITQKRFSIPSKININCIQFLFYLLNSNHDRDIININIISSILFDIFTAFVENPLIHYEIILNFAKLTNELYLPIYFRLDIIKFIYQRHNILDFPFRNQFLIILKNLLSLINSKLIIPDELFPEQFLIIPETQVQNLDESEKESIEFPNKEKILSIFLSYESPKSLFSFLSFYPKDMKKLDSSYFPNLLEIINILLSNSTEMRGQFLSKYNILDILSNLWNDNFNINVEILSMLSTIFSFVSENFVYDKLKNIPFDAIFENLEDYLETNENREYVINIFANLLKETEKRGDNHDFMKLIIDNDDVIEIFNEYILDDNLYKDQAIFLLSFKRQ